MKILITKEELVKRGMLVEALNIKDIDPYAFEARTLPNCEIELTEEQALEIGLIH
jgi:hypothetical protein